MKNLIRICALLFAAALVLCGAGCAKEEDPFYTKPAGLDFWICEDAAGADFSGFNEIPGLVGAREYVNARYRLPPAEADGFQDYPEKYVSYKISAWPDLADGGEYVTQIVITDPSVKLFGVTVESTIDEFIEAMTAAGFSVREQSSGANVSIRFADSPDGKYNIRFLINGDERMLSVNAVVTNRDNIVY